MKRKIYGVGAGGREGKRECEGEREREREREKEGGREERGVEIPSANK